MKVSEMLYYAVHPYKFRAMVHWKLLHVPLHERNVEKECATLQRCFHFLDLTSRSFSAVIQELTPELCVPVALFYLILRGLDTIEDDMTLPLEKKEPLLRTFDQILDTPGWNFKENGPNEKDRQLCCEFEVVIEEFAKIKPAYREIIKDITHKMGNGMADYANNAEHNTNGVDSIEDYDLYCYYVAGLVGDGLTRLFVEAKLANPVLLDRPELSNSMGLFLQKTNIIRDIREDFDDGRRFYPKEIWTKHVDRFDQLFDPKNKEAALNCISEMCLNALSHADECLFYLAGIKDQSVFHFTAIPQVMAIATLALVFRNPDILERNVKIPKGEACELMLDVGNLRSTSNIFRKYMKIIHKKNTPKDPNYLKISLALGKIEQWIEAVFPTPKDAALEELVARANAPKPLPAIPTSQLVALVSVTLGILIFMSGVMLFCAHLAGARFDVAFNNLYEGFRPVFDSIQKAAMDAGIIKPLVNATAAASGVAHNEL